MNKTTVIPCKRISQRELPSEINLTQIYQRDMIHTDLNSFWFSHAMTSTAYVIASNFRTFLFRLQNDQVATEKFCWYPRNAYQVKALQRQQNLLNELLGVQLTLTRMMNQIQAKPRFNISNMTKTTQLLPGKVLITVKLRPRYGSILNRIKSIYFNIIILLHINS